MNQQQETSPRQVAVLFTDLKGSTAFYRKYGNLAGRVMIQKHNALLFPIVQDHAGAVVKTMGDSICAYFTEPDSALDAAVAMQKKLASYNEDARDDERLLIRIAVHYGECLIEEQDIFGYAVDIAGVLVSVCDPREILVTGAFQQCVQNRADMTCTPRALSNPPEALASATVYRIEWQARQPADAQAAAADSAGGTAGGDFEQNGFLAPFIPGCPAREHDVACFYCGMTAHDAGRCPSKLLQHATAYLDRLAYLPFAEIRGIYNEFFAEYVRPLEPAANEQRYTLLFEQEGDSRFALGFFSLYEMSEIFQLRSLHRLFAAKDSSDETPYRTSGALMIGRDCLRVARGSEADEWFHQAVKENPNDYRPYVDMGIVAMERMDPSRAISFFRKAHAAAESERTRRHITLLSSRAYEIAGAPSRACDDMRKVLDPAHPWHEGLYYYAVLLARLGKAADAIAVLKTLLEHSERYYLILLLDPSLNSVRDDISAVLHGRYADILAKSRESFASITSTCAEVKKYFSESDPEYRTAQALYRKASSYLREAGIAGLLDVASIELDIDRLLMRGVEQRRRQADESVARFRDIHSGFTRYLERYPYRQAVTAGDLRLRDEVKALFTLAVHAVNTISLERLRQAQEVIGKLAAAADSVASARQRLEIMKNLYFIAEFSFRLAVSFFGTGILAGGLFVLLVSAYQVFNPGSSGLHFEAIVRYCRHGLMVGFFSGLLGAAVWFKRSFRKMFAKLGE